MEEEYTLTRTGNLLTRCLTRPFDTTMRDEIEKIIYLIANRNPRPIIFERDFTELIGLLEEMIGNVKLITDEANK